MMGSVVKRAAQMLLILRLIHIVEGRVQIIFQGGSELTVDEGAGTVMVQILIKNAIQDFTLTVTAVDITALLTLDYNLSPDEFAISRDSVPVTANLYIDIVDDNLLETEESFNIVLFIAQSILAQLLVKIRDPATATTTPATTTTETTTPDTTTPGSTTTETTTPDSTTPGSTTTETTTPDSTTTTKSTTPDSDTTTPGTTITQTMTPDITIPSSEIDFTFSVLDSCESSPCLHGGTCMSVNSTFTCMCATGFSGEICEISGPYGIGIVILSLGGGAFTMTLVFCLMCCLCGRRRDDRNPTPYRIYKRIILLRGFTNGPRRPF